MKFDDLWNLAKAAMPFLGVSGLIAAIFIHWLTKSREREARAAVRESLIADSQRETLVSVQGEAVKLKNATSEGRRLDVLSLQATDKLARWPDPLLNAQMAARDQIMVLRVRVRDDVVKELIGTFKEQCLAATHNFPSREQSRVNMRDANETFRLLQDRIGEVLTALDSSMTSTSKK
jgi:hypothetical protein